MTEPPEIVAFRREREAMKRQMHARLEQIRQTAINGDVTPDQLRADILGVIHAYVPGAASKLESSLSTLVARYAELTSAQERLRVFEDFIRSIDG